MKIKMLVLLLTLTAITWAQSATPATPSDKPAASTASDSKPACCEKMAKQCKEMSCCKGDAKNAKSDMACCHGDAMGDKSAMSCCNGKDANACVQNKDKKDAASASCCRKDAACCKEGAACCGAKAKSATAAKGCCDGAKCDRHAHQHTSGM